MKKLKNFLMETFPDVGSNKNRYDPYWITIPNTEPLESIKNELNKFFVEEGYDIVVKEDKNDLAFKKGKEIVFVMIADLPDGYFYLFIVKLKPKEW